MTTVDTRTTSAVFPGFFGAALVFVPVLLFLAGSTPEGGAYANVELGFSLLAALGASGCVAGLISTAYRSLEASSLGGPQFVWLPASPQLAPPERLEVRERTLPVVTPSLVLPTLLSGLGGWVEHGAAPRRSAPTTAS